MQNQEFKMVDLADIRPDPNQPRKSYDELAMDDLVNSIREKGVIQPILIRPNGKGYMIVCGERRYRASKTIMAEERDRSTIPAIIREMSDEEAVDLQLIENLQRQDVHPLDEAFVFANMKMRGKSVEEISLRTGKGIRFIKQRLVLSNLTENWQKVLFHNHIELTMAMRIAQLAKDNQELLYDEEVEEKYIGVNTYKFNITKGDIRKHSSDLDSAPFDIGDASINPEMGACTTCPHNTGVHSLFPDENGARCTLPSCFVEKADMIFKSRLDQAIEEGDVFFVVPPDDAKKKESIAKKFDIEVLELSGWRVESDPLKEVDTFEEWVESCGDGETNEEMQQEYEKYLEEKREESKKFHNEIAIGKLKKVFWVSGDDKGRYDYTEEFNKSSPTKSSGTKPSGDVAAGEITASDIQESIRNLESRQRRSVELDENKLWEQVRPHFSPKSNSSIFKHAAITEVELKAIANTIYKKLTYTNQSEFRKEWFDKKGNLKPIVPADLNIMLRYFMLAELPPTVVYSGIKENSDAAVSMEIAREYFPSVVEGIEAEIKAKAEKRAANVAKKIADLKKQLAELKKAAKKPAEKKPAAKKGKAAKAPVEQEDEE